MSEFLLLEYATTASISEPQPPFSGLVSYFVKYNFLVFKIENIYIENNELKFDGNIEEIRFIGTPRYNVSGSYNATTLDQLTFINSGYTSTDKIIYYTDSIQSLGDSQTSATLGNLTFKTGSPMPYNNLSELQSNIGNLSTNYIFDNLFSREGLTFDIYALLESAWADKDFSMLGIPVTAYDDEVGLSFAKGLISDGSGVRYPTVIGVYSTIGVPTPSEEPKDTDSDYSTTPDNIDEVPKADVDEDGKPTAPSVGTTIYDALLTGNTAYYLLTPAELNKFWELFWGIPDIQTILLNSLTGMFDSLSKCVLGIQLYPFNISDYCTTVTSAPAVGRYVLDTNMPRITSFTYEIDLGSFDFSTKKTFGSEEKPHFLDYAPYTKFDLYLPFVSNVIELDTNLWQYSRLDIALAVDLTTGRGLYRLKRYGLPIQYIDCKVGIDIPFILDDMISTVSNATKGIVKGAVTGNAMDAISNINFPPLDIHSEISDSTAYLASLRPRVSISRPIPRYPKTFAKTIGYKTFTTKKLEEVSGFAIIDKPVLNMSENMTSQEYDMIITKLKEGIYL